MHDSSRLSIQLEGRPNHRHVSIWIIAFRACCWHKICILALCCTPDCWLTMMDNNTYLYICICICKCKCICLCLCMCMCTALCVIKYMYIVYRSSPGSQLAAAFSSQCASFSGQCASFSIQCASFSRQYASPPIGGSSSLESSEKSAADTT